VDLTAHGGAFLILKKGGGGMFILQWLIYLVAGKEVLAKIDEAADYYANLERVSQPIPKRLKVQSFRVFWLRVSLILAWWLAFFLTIVSTFVELYALWQSWSFTRSSGQNGLTWMGYAGSLGGVNFIFNLWSFAALFTLSRAWNRRVWGMPVKHPFRLVCALAMIFGRLIAVFWSFLFALIPDLWWLFPIKYGLLPPVVLLMGGFGAMLASYVAFMTFLTTLIFIPLKVLAATLELQQQFRSLQVSVAPVIGVWVECWLWLTGRRLPEIEENPDESKGARFATPREIDLLRLRPYEALTLEEKVGAGFGHVGGAPLLLANKKHVLMMASTRSGKGVSLIIPHLLRYPGSAFVLDPKGENAKATYLARTLLNHKVHVLDPFGLTGLKSARFNPLAYLTPANMEAESKALAAALVLGERDHWKASAQQLLAAFILFVVTNEAIPKEQKDLRTVRMLLLSGARITLKAMQESSAADGLLSMLATSFLETPEKEFGSILSTAQRETEILDNPQVAKCLAASGDSKEIDFSDWHKMTTTVYLCLPAPMFPIFNRWLRLVLTSALNEMTTRLNPPILPVCFLLDELAALGHLDVVENAASLAAGYGVQMWSVFQDVPQMKDLYKERWQSFVGNAGVRVAFNLDDVESAEYWSRFVGGRLIETKHISQNEMGYTTGQSQSEVMRPLLAPEQIMKVFAADRMLVLPQGSSPIIADRVPYYEDEKLAGLWIDPRRSNVNWPEEVARWDSEKKNKMRNLESVFIEIDEWAYGYGDTDNEVEKKQAEPPSEPDKSFDPDGTGTI
jgi:type IV secretion system protein VirD4